MAEASNKLVSKCYATKPADHDLKAVKNSLSGDGVNATGKISFYEFEI